MTIKKFILSLYLMVVVVVGIVFVPVTEKWGPELKVDTKKFVAIWELVDHHKRIDGYVPIYDLDIIRVIFEIGIATLIAYLLIFITNKKENK